MQIYDSAKVKNIQSLTSRKAIEKYRAKNWGVIWSTCFSLSDCVLFIAACNIAVIAGDVQGRSWNAKCDYV